MEYAHHQDISDVLRPAEARGLMYRKYHSWENYAPLVNKGLDFRLMRETKDNSQANLVSRTKPAPAEGRQSTSGDSAMVLDGRYNLEDQGRKPTQDKTEDNCLVSVNCYSNANISKLYEDKKEIMGFRGNPRSGSHFGDKHSLKERA